MTQSKAVISICSSISRDRLESYRIIVTDSPVDLLDRYIYNIKIAEALYPSLQCLACIIHAHFE